MSHRSRSRLCRAFLAVAATCAALLVSVPDAAARQAKVKVCHIPFGDPAGARTIRIAKRALRAHLSHGDFLGPCRVTPPACEPGRTAGAGSRCFEAVVARPEVAEVLDDRVLLPALADGRLSLEEIARRLRINDAVPTTRLGEEPDPGENVDVNRRVLERLRRAEGFEIDEDVITRAGPVVVESYVPRVPGGFPVIDRSDAENHLDFAGFTLDLHDTLSPNVNGYAMRMRRKGQTVATLQWNWARNPNLADVPPIGWNTYRRMHLASISKFMTAIGLVHLLRAKGIDTDDAIIDYLPDYWTPGANVFFITFEDLMNHVSGFGTGGSDSDWSTMESNVEAGVNFFDIGSNFDYENMNFGLIRILIATIGGYIHPSTNFGNELFNDLIWDVFTSAAYDHYMQTNVFNPVGAFPVLAKNPFTALAYRSDASGTGWNSGSFLGSPGGVGWHMTINEILDVARALRAGQIVSADDAQTILDQSWGLNSPIFGENTEAGRIYYKPGKWTRNGNPDLARTEQCVLMMMPDDMEVVVFVNSEVRGTTASLNNIVRTLYKDNIIIVK